MKNKILFSVVFALLFGLTLMGSVSAQELVCKEQVHYYYFSLADHETTCSLSSGESKVKKTSYSSVFANTLPEGATIKSQSFTKGFTKNDIAMWFDLYIANPVLEFTDESGAIHHVHTKGYTNNDTNKTDNKSVNDSVKKAYDLLKTDAERTAFRTDYIERTYAAQIMPTTASASFEIVSDGIKGTIDREYDICNNNNTPFKFSDGTTDYSTYLISGVAKVIYTYDCEEPVEPTKEPDEPTKEPTKEPEPEPIIEENPNTGDLGLALSGVLLTAAGGSTAVIYRKRKNLKEML